MDWATFSVPHSNHGLEICAAVSSMILDFSALGGGGQFVLFWNLDLLSFFIPPSARRICLATPTEARLGFTGQLLCSTLRLTLIS